ncbi:MAG: hypothetical protein PHQ75_05605, partial [Thermoguttaceae bacterium]|nr:hypothetical protein [Thermoguttaceae bacterium]
MDNYRYTQNDLEQLKNEVSTQKFYNIIQWIDGFATIVGLFFISILYFLFTFMSGYSPVCRDITCIIVF